MSKIGAIWVLDKNKANNIHSDFDKYASIFIWVSENGKYWSGTADVDPVINTVQIGNSMMADLNYLVADTYPDKAWDRLRQKMINGGLGPPTYGNYPINRKTLTHCVCDISMLMYNGCPSSNGLECQSRS